MSISNPHNGYVPKVGEKVRIIGACHPMLLGKIVEVTNVFYEEEKWWFENKHYNSRGELFYSSGELGGVEAVDQNLPCDIC